MLTVEIEVEANRLNKRFSNQRNCCAPNCILGGKPAGEGVVVSGAQVVVPGLPVVVLPTVAEWVGIGGHRVTLVAEGVIPVIDEHVAVGIQQMQHIPMGIELVVLVVAVDLPRHQVLTTDVSAIHRIGHADLRHDILPIPSMDMGNCGIPAAGCLAVPHAVRTIGIGGRDTAGYRRGDRSQLSKSIIRPRLCAVNGMDLGIISTIINAYIHLWIIFEISCIYYLLVI